LNLDHLARKHAFRTGHDNKMVHQVQMEGNN
jgi:hypothetical protein